jgi:folate-binding protein YgfZ
MTTDEAEMLRVEAGRPRFAVDFDEERLPQEAGLDDALSFTKGCFFGQEVVVRLRDRGQLNRRLVGLRSRVASCRRLIASSVTRAVPAALES